MIRKSSSLASIICALTLLLISSSSVVAQINNNQTVSDENLVVYYDFQDNSSLDVRDFSKNQNHGKMHNMTTDSYIECTMPSSEKDKALKFDGIDDYVEVPDDNSLNPTDEITISSWVYIEENTGEYQHICRKDDQYILRVEPESTNFYVYIDGSWKGLSWQEGSASELAGEWHHITAVYNGSEMKLYHNGNEVASRNQTGEINITSNNLFIGSRNGSNWFLNGKLNGLRIYGHSLNEEKIETIYREFSPLLEINGIQKSVGWTENGRYEEGLEFDGIDDYVEVPDDSWLDVDDELTISAWVKCSGDTGGYQAVAYKDDAYILRIGKGYNSYQFYQHIGGSWTALTGGNPGEHTGEWIHLVGTYDSEGDRRLYLNGTQIASDSQTGSIDNSDIPLGIGAKGGAWNQDFNGKIDDVRIYDRILTEDEVEKLHDENDVENGLVAYFPLNEGVGEKVYDRTSNSLVGEIHSRARVRENIGLLARIYKLNRDDAPAISEATFEINVDGKEILSTDLDPSKIKPGTERLVKVPWIPKEIGKHKIEADLKYENAELTHKRTIEVGPPLNPPLKSLNATATETGEGLKVTINPVSVWDYEESDWNTTSEVKVYLNKLLRNKKTLETTYNISGSPPRFTIPYDKFYEVDGNYTVKIEFLGENLEKTVGVAGRDRVYDPPNELAWLLSVFWIGVALALAYIVKSHYSKNK